jgi:hypothetical protein
MPPTVALLTDFGTQDTYVGVMKAVMLGICPDVRFIDLSHNIQPQNVRQAALALLTSYRFCPSGTVFLTVVDPGVGSSRKPIAVQAGDYTFVAPDNGLLSYVLADFPALKIVELNNPVYQRQPVSKTFHGRDIFAPAAAHLAAGTALAELGTVTERYAKQLSPQMKISGSLISGNVLYADHFGNLITSIGELVWEDSGTLALTPRFGSREQTYLINTAQSRIAIGSAQISGIRATYASVVRGNLLALVGSSGFLEIAANQGSAAEVLKLAAGAAVTLEVVE